VCGRFVQEKSLVEVAELFDAEPMGDDPGPRYNIAPTDPGIVVVQRPDGPRGATVFSWGLIPHWADNPTAAARHINARAETVASTPAFRDSFRRKRCIVPADGFYEWTHAGTVRQPHFIHRCDGAPLAFAGLWSSWRMSPEAPTRRTFTIITTRANDAIAPLHDRMPVALPAEAWDRWLDPRTPLDGELLALLEPPAAEAFETFPVERLVNSVRNQGPALIQPLATLL
jgi:putative SOS response-associated peptidase YedK